MKKSYLFILTFGVFSILNTEMGVIGILPMIAAEYGVDAPTAGLLVSLFALVIAIAGPIMPLIFSRFAQKKVMVLVLSIFTACNIFVVFATDFSTMLIARIIPAFFHPVYVSLAFSIAADSAEQVSDVPKAVSKVMMGVSAGMVLGAPLAGLISDTSSLQFGLLFFAVVNALALIATIMLVPTLPPKEPLSYSSQLYVLKKKALWTAIIGVILLNGSVFGVYSYISSYLGEVTGLSTQFISGLLFVYGLMNIVGNSIAGTALSNNANRFIGWFPVMMGAIYVAMFLWGSYPVAVAVLILLWGILAGAAGNINQYWISSSAPETPEFANGLFLTASNLGITVATLICGLLINNYGMDSILLGGLLLLLSSVALIFVKIAVLGAAHTNKSAIILQEVSE